jgi:hypothetical protein
VKTPLKKFHPVGLDQIDTTMLLGDTPRPNVRLQVFQGFGLADTFKRASQRSLDEIKQAFGMSSSHQALHQLSSAVPHKIVLTLAKQRFFSSSR